MKEVCIAIGTISKQKIEVVRDTLSSLHLSATLYPTAVESGVSEQPLTSEETRVGSLNRATRALHAHLKLPMDSKLHRLGLGIEVGYQQNEQGLYEILCWASLVEMEGDAYIETSCCSHSFLLPSYYQQLLRQGLPLGEHVEEYAVGKEGIALYLAHMLRDRTPFLTSCLRDVFLQCILRQEFTR